MEADLQAVYRVDYRDRWRKDEHGRPLLTLRRLAVLVTHLPAWSAVRTIDEPYWPVEAHLLDDVRMTLMALAHVETKYLTPHPARPGKNRVDPLTEVARAKARKRAAERRRKIEAGEIV